METHMVQAVFAAGAEDSFPAVDVHRRVASQGKDAALDGSAKKGFPAVHKKPVFFYFELTHTEIYPFLVSSALACDLNVKMIQGRGEFIPELHPAAEFQSENSKGAAVLQLYLHLFLLQDICDRRIEAMGFQPYDCLVPALFQTAHCHLHSGAAFSYIRIDLYVICPYCRRAFQTQLSHHSVPVALSLI